MENCNGYNKTQLGSNGYINWINFFHFIKKESERPINKLLDNSNNNVNDININDNEAGIALNNIKNNDNNNNFIHKNNKMKNNNILIDKKLNNNDMINENIKNENHKYKINNLINENTKTIYNTMIGIDNFGNNCFAISFIQSIVHCNIIIKNYIDIIKVLYENTNTIYY